MSDILELSVQYRISGTACREKLKEVNARLEMGRLRPEEAIELRRRKTMLTAMSRDCIATSNYLKTYYERRKQLETIRRQTGA